MIFVDKIMDMLQLKGDYDDYDDGMGYDVQGNAAIAPAYAFGMDYEEPIRKNISREENSRANHKITPIRSKAKNNSGFNAHFQVIKPVDMNSCRDIANVLLDGSVVLLNYQGVDGALSQRISDFVSGTVYSINGRLEHIAQNVIIAAPAGVGVDGDFLDLANASLEIPSFRK